MSGGTVCSHQLLKKFSALYWTPRIFTVFNGPMVKKTAYPA